MRTSLLTRAGSIAAAAVIATGGAMATAGAAGAMTTAGAGGAAAHARRLPTHLSVAKVRAAVAHHKHVRVIGGRLTSYRTPVRGKVIFLDRRTAKSRWVVVGRERTNRFGAVAFVVDPKADARYVLVFRGTPNFRSSHSRAVAVKA